MKTTAKFISKVAVAISSMAMLPMAAEAALWQGGATGDMMNPGNWCDGDGSSGSIVTSGMNFTNNCTVTLSDDAVIFMPWGTKKNTDESIYKKKSIVFDMGGHTLCATNSSASMYVTGDSSVVDGK